MAWIAICNHIKDCLQLDSLLRPNRNLVYLIMKAWINICFSFKSMNCQYNNRIHLPPKRFCCFQCRFHNITHTGASTAGELMSDDTWHRIVTMASSNGNIFHVIGPLCGTSPVTVELPSERPMTRGFDAFFDLRLNKRLRKQSRRRWFETPSRSLCCDVTVMLVILSTSTRHFDCVISLYVFSHISCIANNNVEIFRFFFCSLFITIYCDVTHVTDGIIKSPCGPCRRRYSS